MAKTYKLRWERVSTYILQVSCPKSLFPYRVLVTEKYGLQAYPLKLQKAYYRRH
jgi:hypothetical protein